MDGMWNLGSCAGATFPLDRRFDTRASNLAALREAVAVPKPMHLDRTIKAAYQAGASREDLITAVEIARAVSDVPGSVVAQAYASIHAWHWIAARRAPLAESLMSIAM